MPRIEVTTPRISSYLGANLNNDNYHLFYGLSRIKPEDYRVIMEGLINGEIFPNDLLRLNTFSEEDVAAFILDFMGEWTSPSVSTPVVGTSGYQLLTDLGVVDILTIATPPQVFDNPLSVLNSRVPIHGDTVYPTVESVLDLLNATVFPDALLTRPLNYYIHSDLSDLTQLPINNTSPERVALFNSIYGSIANAMIQSGKNEESAGLFMISIGQNMSFLKDNISYAQWLLVESFPYRNRQLLLHREAARLNANGVAYDETYVEALILSLENFIIPLVATSIETSKFAFSIYLLEKIVENNLLSNPLLIDRISILSDVSNAIHYHRGLTRDFCKRLYTLAQAKVFGIS